MQGGFVYQTEQYDRDGYLEKEFKTSNIEYKSVKPTLEEITKFNGGAVEQGEELSLLAASTGSNVAKASDFQTGEKVIVLSGEMKNVEGVVSSVVNDIVTIIPDSSYGLKVCPLTMSLIVPVVNSFFIADLCRLMCSLLPLILPSVLLTETTSRSLTESTKTSLVLSSRWKTIL